MSPPSSDDGGHPAVDEQHLAVDVDRRRGREEHHGADEVVDGALLDVRLADWNRVFTTDLTSAFLVGREVARHQLARGSGKIINICSVQTDLARPSNAPYTAAKGGLRNLTPP